MLITYQSQLTEQHAICWWSIKRGTHRTQNTINAERSKGTEQVKITEQGTEQMEIIMNPHTGNNCIHGADIIKRGTN